ncbi:AAA family ATPase [uncultured Bilophila sp.]|uniref:AAA family ATPase n=1 Tax=uncultured Bilophila sp. TaxID=529385 RepID=UPI002634CDCC|nr:AAA family ATPase [uncultured Bilophila sp.]
MRILELGFKNLNSLAGEWKINFNHTSFTSDGIFAIIGPTGAGKTTILDALCLALYGRTPRLKSISKTENEIMSRHTGECYAEVTFETQAGRVRCRWSQRRARSRPGGDLQPPRRECANAITNEVLESKLDGFTARVEELTGMDYARFTRSMLLAQGGFTAFLNASPDERAPILEQLTGMEIYSDISKTVHARTVAERSQLERLEAELAGLHLLDEAAGSRSRRP